MLECICGSCTVRFGYHAQEITSDEDQRPTSMEYLGKFMTYAGGMGFALGGIVDGVGTILEFGLPSDDSASFSMTSPGMITVYVGFGLNVLGLVGVMAGLLVSECHAKRNVCEDTALLDSQFQILPEEIPQEDQALLGGATTP